MVNIEIVGQHRHLGLTLSANGKWNNHIENILVSASKVIGIMRNLKYSFSRVALNQIYIWYVRPLFEYSPIVWDNCTAEQANSIERLQNEAARIVTGLTRSVSLEKLYNECLWESLALRRKKQKLKFMYKVTHNMGSGVYPKTLYHHRLERFLDMTCVIDKLFLLFLSKLLYLRNLAFHHQFLLGIILS